MRVVPSTRNTTRNRASQSTARGPRSVSFVLGDGHLRHDSEHGRGIAPSCCCAAQTCVDSARKCSGRSEPLAQEASYSTTATTKDKATSPIAKLKRVPIRSLRTHLTPVMSSHGTMARFTSRGRQKAARSLDNNNNNNNNNTRHPNTLLRAYSCHKSWCAMSYTISILVRNGKTAQEMTSLGIHAPTAIGFR